MNLAAMFSKWSDDLSFRVKGLFLLIFPLSALLFVVWLIATMASGRRAAEQWVNDSNQVRFSTQRAEMRLLEMESQLGAYLLTGNTALLSEHANSEASLLAALSQLSDVASNPNARRRLAEIRRAISSEYSPLWSTGEGNTESSPAKALGPESRQHFQEQISLLAGERTKLEAMETEENRFLAQRLSHQERLYAQLFLTAIAVACFCPIFGFALNLLLGARISKRLVRLQRFVHLLVHEMPMMSVPGGKDEIGQLGKALGDAALALNERERGLLRREQQLIDVFERMPVAMHEMDTQGIIRRANQAECELLGYKSAEIVGRHAWDLVSVEQQTACRQMVMAVVQGDPAGEDLVQDYLRKDGARIRLSVRLKAIDAEHGRAKGLCSVLLHAPAPRENVRVNGSLQHEQLTPVSAAN